MGYGPIVTSPPSLSDKEVYGGLYNSMQNGVVFSSIPYLYVQIWTDLFRVQIGGDKVYACNVPVIENGVLQVQAYAVKRIQAIPGGFTKDVSESKYLAEIEILSEISHKNILKLIGVSRDGPHLCMVLERCRWGSLPTHFHDEYFVTGLTWRARMKVAAGLMRAVQYLHASPTGIPLYHNNICCSNILLTYDWEPKLIDFRSCGRPAPTLPPT
eukprot:gene2785-3396_t